MTDIIPFAVGVVGVVALIGFALLVGEAVSRYFQSHLERSDPQSWQHFPAVSRYILLVTLTPLLVFFHICIFPNQLDSK
ncbi:hypothetical protein [Actinomyces respiraculi]|uniref:hypothetical protein n=1 Tax=Actinomyces respiraculi TaxID=2744574 RepID=UPI00141FF221|nr:hypothetical protein [Actinomyces respiraculi]